MAEAVGRLFYDVTLETGQMVRGQREVQRQLDATSSALDRFDAKLTSIARAIGVYAAALAVVKAANTADDVRLLGSRMEVAAGSADLAASAMQRLQQISAATQTSIAANVQVFTRLNQSILQMGGNQGDTLRVTELLAKAIKVSGASAQEASAAMLQFGQALGSGRLQGDELRSLSENAPYLMRQLADALGVPQGALKKLGEDGKLTADVVVNALSKASGQINNDFDKLGPTMAGAFTVAKDAAGRLTEALDTASNRSAQLTGLTKGVGEVMDALAGKIRDVASESDKLNRAQAVQQWAETTRTVLSYVVDAADMTWQAVSVLGRNVYFALESSGRFLAAVGAVYTEVLRGNISGAREIGAALDAQISASRAKLDAADQKTLADRKLWGEQMRDAWRQAVVEDRGFTPTAQGSKLKPPAGGDAEAAKKAAAARLKGELQQLEAEQQIRDEQDKLTQKFYADQQAKADKAAAEEEKRAQERARNLATAQDVLAGSDPIARLDRELQRKTEMLKNAAALDLENATFYAQAQVALEEEISAKKADIWKREAEQRAANDALAVSLAAGTADQLYQVLERAGKERTALGKALFMTSKALAVAEIIMNAELGASKAMGMGPFGVPMATYIRAAGYASAGIVAGLAIGQLAGGRQYGGPASAGNLYRVNETGQPEMFVGSGGRQYMMPTKDGRVVPADQVGGGGVAWTINVIGAPPGTTASVDESARTIDIAVARVASQLAENSGPIAGALRNGWNVTPRNNG